jgi:hypothetical protein
LSDIYCFFRDVCHFIAMPTDGADFQKRRPTQGRYFVAVKNGATSVQLAECALEALEARIKQEKMPMLRAMADVVLDCITGQPLLSRSPKIFARTLKTGLDAVAEGFSEIGITREVGEQLERVGLRLRMEGATLSPNQCRDRILGDFAETFVQADLLDRARCHTARHRQMESSEVQRLEQRILGSMRPQLLPLMQSVYANPRGTPTSRWKTSPPILLHTAEALQAEVISVSE